MVNTAPDDGLGCPIGSLFLYHLHGEDPLRTTAIACVGVALLCWIVSTATNNYSQVDKLWSITPFVYAWILVVGQSKYSGGGGVTETLPPSRVLLMALVVTVWGVRLTYNFGRRDGYSWPRVWKGLEDYRWQMIREGKFLLILRHPVAWHIFNFAFISCFQHVLLWLIVVPPMMIVHIVATADACGSTTGSEARGGLLVLDYFYAIACLSCIGIEAIADDQQYVFQSQKYAMLQQKNTITSKLQLTGDYADGFLQSGLFAIVRKPNYAAEQAFWITFYGWSASVTAAIVDRFEYNQLFAATGCVLLILLFQRSGPFTEIISCSKYPRYKDYQNSVPLYVPWRLGLLWGDNRRQHHD